MFLQVSPSVFFSETWANYAWLESEKSRETCHAKWSHLIFPANKLMGWLKGLHSSTAGKNRPLCQQKSLMMWKRVSDRPVGCFFPPMEGIRRYVGSLEQSRYRGLDTMRYGFEYFWIVFTLGGYPLHNLGGGITAAPRVLVYVYI